MNKIIQGDCLEVMKDIPDNSVDAIVTDPPYGLSFMGKKWDYDVPSVEIWTECLRVLKPGGYLLAFAGTRTQHRMAVRIEDAGFEIRDMIAWIYGSGFPKSLNIGKAVDKLQGNEREVTGGYMHGGTRQSGILGKDLGQVWHEQSQGTSEWEGWGTALKPALEPITVARKPLSENTVAENCLKWGTGGINIDGSRVGTDETITNHSRGAESAVSKGKYGDSNQQETHQTTGQQLGRFPANLIHDGSEEVLNLFPQANHKTGSKFQGRGLFPIESEPIKYNDSGSAARFFYCAKSSKSERNRGLEVVEVKNTRPQGEAFGNGNAIREHQNRNGNNHPTVKPIKLMEYLVNLVSKPGATVLDPFLGSGTTAIACKNLNRNCIGIERDVEYIEIINKRLQNVEQRLI